ncbi:hypothetical protein [Dactylosporangium darangshiense]|uniref:BMP family ABC transporter substrate-binding protein n=1 Tax=Dactylosporangium darangshiense TaxID=579108 RepID=A0ABP8DSF5_9ACTN
MLRNLTRWQVLAGAGVLVVVVALLVTWLAWPDDKPAPRERQYKSTTACLLTDDKDLAGDLAKAAWAGMQDASLATLIKVQHLAITGPQTPANALTFYNSLGVQHCTVIIAAGDVPVAAMTQGYAGFPDIKQAAVGGDVQGKPITVVDASSPESIRNGVKTIVAASA